MEVMPEQPRRSHSCGLAGRVGSCLTLKGRPHCRAGLPRPTTQFVGLSVGRPLALSARATPRGGPTAGRVNPWTETETLRHSRCTKGNPSRFCYKTWAKSRPETILAPRKALDGLDNPHAPAHARPRQFAVIQISPVRD
jgi:hypothetical protein